MSATLTIETVEIETRPVIYAALGYTYCGKCHNPNDTEPQRIHTVRDPRSVYDASLEGQWRPETDAEYRSAVLREHGACDGCRAHPADFPVFVQTGTATIEHTPCRIF